MNHNGCEEAPTTLLLTVAWNDEQQQSIVACSSRHLIVAMMKQKKTPSDKFNHSYPQSGRLYLVYFYIKREEKGRMQTLETTRSENPLDADAFFRCVVQMALMTFLLSNATA